MMKQLVRTFPDQLKHALEIGKATLVPFPKTNFTNIVIAGLGGSGIGGNLVQAIVSDSLKLPVTVIKGYSVPEFVNEDTLFIASSFSGNTEETITVTNEAINRNATIVAVTSGGELLKIAEENSIPYIKIPGESKSPRANLGYSAIQMLFVLYKAGLLADTFITEITALAETLETTQQEICDDAMNLSKAMVGKLPILYAGTRFEAVVVRSQQQINENSKQLCHTNVFPEMNHNELVGWVYPEAVLKQSVVVLVKSSLDHERVALRMKFCKPIFEEKAVGVLEIQAKGNSYLEQAFYLIHLFDWISVYLAEHNGVDPAPVKVIDTLKNQLAEA